MLVCIKPQMPTVNQNNFLKRHIAPIKSMLSPLLTFINQQNLVAISHFTQQRRKHMLNQFN